MSGIKKFLKRSGYQTLLSGYLIGTLWRLFCFLTHNRTCCLLDVILNALAALRYLIFIILSSKLLFLVDGWEDEHRDTDSFTHADAVNKYRSRARFCGIAFPMLSFSMPLGIKFILIIFPL